MAKGFWQGISGWWNKSPESTEKASEVHQADDQTQREGFLREFEQLSQASDQANESGDIKKAADLQARAVLALLKAVEPIANAEIAEFVADQFTKAGILKIQMDDYMFARMDFLPCLLHRQTIHKVKNSPQSAEKLAVAYLALAMLEEHEGKIDDAIGYYESHIQIGSQIARQNPGSDVALNLQRQKDRLDKLKAADTTNHDVGSRQQTTASMEEDESDFSSQEPARNAGRTFRQSGMFEPSLNCLLEAAESGLRWFSKSATVETALDCAQTFNELYETQWAVGDTNGMLDALKHRGRFEKFIYEQTKNLEAMYHYSKTQSQKGDLYFDHKDFQRATKYYLRLMEIARKIDEAGSNPQRLTLLARAYQKLGMVNLELKAFKEAGEYLQKSHEMFVQVSNQVENEQTLRNHLMSFYWIAALEQKRGNTKEATDLINHTIKNALKMYGLSKSHAVLMDLANYYHLLGKLLLDTGNLQDADKWLTESNTLWRQLLTKEFNTQNQKGLLAVRISLIRAKKGQAKTDLIANITKGIEDFKERFPKSHFPNLLQQDLVEATG